MFENLFLHQNKLGVNRHKNLLLYLTRLGIRSNACDGPNFNLISFLKDTFGLSKNSFVPYYSKYYSTIYAYTAILVEHLTAKLTDLVSGQSIEVDPLIQTTCALFTKIMYSSKAFDAHNQEFQVGRDHTFLVERR